MLSSSALLNARLPRPISQPSFFPYDRLISLSNRGLSPSNDNGMGADSDDGSRRNTLEGVLFLCPLFPFPNEVASP